MPLAAGQILLSSIDQLTVSVRRLNDGYGRMVGDPGTVTLNVIWRDISIALIL
jgi:hypothetical protein